jgi:DNA-binding response OmpR family regulator
MSDIGVNEETVVPVLQTQDRLYRVGDILINHNKQLVTKGELPLKFSPIEYNILFSLVYRSYTRKLVLRSDILSDVYDDKIPASNSFVKLVSNIRLKLQNAESVLAIQPVRSRGYELRLSSGSLLSIEVL